MLTTLHEIHHHWIQPALFDVWVLTLLTHVNFYFHMIRGTKKHQCVDHYVAELCEWLWEAFEEASGAVHVRGRETESGTMIGKLMPFHWNQITWSWLKLMPIGGGEK